MDERNDITVIIPVHELNSATEQLFVNAIKSVAEQFVLPNELLIVTSKNTDTEKFLNSYDYGTIKHMVRIVSNEGQTDFASQINFGVENVKTKWFSILEFDDEYSKIWFKNVFKYISAYPNVDVFMPIIVDTNSGGAFIGLMNEAVWAQSFSDELGILTNDALLAYQNFNIDGIVMKTEQYKEFGGFKPSIKLTFIYEFLLRMTHKDSKVFVIPKFGYKHLNQRLGSLFNNYVNEMNPVEAKWWLSQAKKEYYFEQDRTLNYEPETN